MRTRDFALASLLVSHDCKLMNHQIDELGRLHFTFEDSELQRTLEREYDLSTATANIQRFTAAQKMLRALIYKERLKHDNRTNGRFPAEFTSIE